MSFFTILAEGIFIYALARVMAGWGPKRSGANGYILPVILFLLLFILLFAGEFLTGLIIDLKRGYRLLIYRVVVWDLMATLYAMLEGIICILTARVYWGLKRSGGPITPARSAWLQPEVWGVVILFLTMFGLFEYMAVNTALQHKLRAPGILNMARFYRIVTGWCWTAFEAGVAVILIKIHLLMKQEKAAS